MNHSHQWVSTLLTLYQATHGQTETCKVYRRFVEVAQEFTAEDIDRETSRNLAKRFRAQPKSCFFNSLTIAKHLAGYRYFEGFATCMIPTEHAWIVSPTGKVIDVTWIRFIDPKVIESNQPHDYYGIEIPWKEAMEHRKKDVWQPAWVEFLMKGSPVHE